MPNSDSICNLMHIKDIVRSRDKTSADGYKKLALRD